MPVQRLKEKILELTGLLCAETGIFQKLVIIYKYIRLLNTDPLAKNILQGIFDETTATMGEMCKGVTDEKEFINVSGEALFTNEFWLYFSNLQKIHDRMKKLKQEPTCNRQEVRDLCNLFSKPYSGEMLELSVKIVNSNVFERLDQEGFVNGHELEGKTYFDQRRSILYIKGQKVLINIQDKITNGHKILKYIFIDNKKNLEDDFFYSEIAEDEFQDTEYKSNQKAWETYHIACRYINKKVMEQTNNKITDFLIYNTGKTGKVKLNKIYL